MIRKLLATTGLVLGAIALLGPVAPASAGGGASDYADCILTAIPTTFNRGASVTVTGAGFQPNFETTIEFNSVTVQVGTALTDAAGAFTTVITVPTNAAFGAHTISAVCDATGNVSSTGVEIEGGAITTTTSPPGPLVRTGSDIEPLVVAGAIALLAGTAFVLVAKRRRATSA